MNYCDERPLSALSVFCNRKDADDVAAFLIYDKWFRVGGINTSYRLCGEFDFTQSQETKERLSVKVADVNEDTHIEIITTLWIWRDNVSLILTEPICLRI
jgi:hypothetical protein